MLIKSVTSKGNAVPHTPEEALPTALEYGLKLQSGNDKVYWVLRGSLVVEGQVGHLINQLDGSYTAQAAGSAMVGYTDVVTDKFFDAKPYNFSVRYHSSKDSIGLPDIKIDEFQM